jgi:outer membrane protein TolC
MNAVWSGLLSIGLLFSPVSAVTAGFDSPPADGGAGLSEGAWRDLQAARLPEHPLAVAARRRVDQAREGRAAADGYFDTLLSASAGAASWTRAIPGSSLPPVFGANRVAVQGGVERPVLPGAVLAAGFAERRLLEPDGGDALYQSLAGIQVRVPLLRNRGLAEWRWDARAAAAQTAAAERELEGVLHRLRYESDTVLVELLQAEADLEAYRLAAERVRRLQEEAETLVRLNVIPEYHLFPARLDASLRAEAVAAAVQRCVEIRTRLEALLGPLPPLETGGGVLLAWAERTAPAPPPDSAGARERRPADAALRAEIAAAEAAEGRARDAVRADLSAILGGTWQGEDADSPWGGDALLEDDTLGYEAALVLRMPLERRRERAAWRATAARAAELRALLENERRQAARELSAAHDAVARARQRLLLVGAAVESGARAMQAEAERFRLGEGRSRNVLDAQKDLSDAELRQHAAAGALLQAQAFLAFAAGYPGGVLPGNAAPRATLEEKQENRTHD